MENKIIDMELEYFKHKNKEICDTLMKEDFKQVIDLAKEPIERIENKVGNERIYCPQNVFEASIYLNFLEPKATQENFSNINYYDFYLMRGAANYNLNKLEEAKEDYQKALRFNPASSVARLQLLEIDKITKKFDTFVDDLKEFFKYAYRRKDIARAYRNFGYYLYEIEEFELAIVAYYLSNVYEITELTTSEIMHISKIANIDLEAKSWLSEEMMGELYNKYKVPLLPDQMLVKLAKAIAEDSYAKKAYGVSLFSYKIVYELTLEEEYLKKIEELQKMVKNK